MTNGFDEETDDPHYADRRNFYKVEKWSRDGLRVMMLLYAGNNLRQSAQTACKPGIPFSTRVVLTV